MIKRNIKSGSGDVTYTRVVVILADVPIKGYDDACYLPEYKMYLKTHDTIINSINSNKIYYKEWFTFKIITSDSDGSPIRFACGVDVDGRSYRIRYYYDSNQIKVNYWNTENEEIYVTNQDDLPEKIKPFVRSLFRYLRKSFDKTEPIWISHSDNP